MKNEFKLQDQFENELHVYMWKPQAKADLLGVVQIIHGKNEHMGRYEDFAKYLNTLGLLVIGHDQLGHGKTCLEATNTHFNDEAGVHHVASGVDCIREYIEEKYPRVPILMFAHSMGSFIGRYALLKHPTRYDMACFSGTGWVNPINLRYALFATSVVKLFKGPQYVSKYITNLLDKAPKSMMKNGIINRREDWISSDKEIVQAVMADEMCNRPFTVSAQRDLMKFIKDTQNMDKIKDGASSTAILFISGELDAMGEYGYTVQRLNRIYRNAGYSNVKFSVVNGSRHEIINEKGREATYKMIGDWYLNRIQK